MPSKPKKSPVTFKEVIAALLDNNRPFSPRYLHQFSDINSNDLDALKKIWLQIEINRRVALLEDLEELSEMSDRLLVMYDGEVVGEFARGAWQMGAVGRLMTGSREVPGAG